tara:strand:- start:143 stop:472 length:330 start_codon:yes stop_codon:yes gene_type:complete
MPTLQHNITSVKTVELLARGDKVSNAKIITFSNTDSSTDARIDLFLYDVANDKSYYILKGVELPKQTTLVLNQEDNIVFDNSRTGFSLRTQIDNGDGSTAVPVDVIIKQ